jgi:outer membrane lipoprotein-sorting protein
MTGKTLLAIVSCSLVVVACSSPKTADEIIAESVRAHGGDALSHWETMLVHGGVYLKEGRVWYNGEYIIYAQKPDKIRMETDLTKFERGRYFYSEILNDDKAWMIRNLLPSYREEYAARYKAKLNRCDGIAYYAENADSFSLMQEDVVGDRAAFVIEATLGERKAKLYIDQENFLLLKEEYDNVTLLYSDFKELGGAVRAGKIVETTTGNRTVEITYTYNTVDIDVDIEPELFVEEMPTS